MSDVFVSHSSKDSEIADRVVRFFEERGLSCWMAPRDIVPGTEWAAAITTAITASKVFLIIYTENSAESGQVAREINLAETKPGVFVVPYKTDDTPLKGSFEYYLTGAHFIAADYAKQDYKLEELYNFVSGIVGRHIQNITNNTHIDTLNIASVESVPEGIGDAVKNRSASQPSAGSSDKSRSSGRRSVLPVVGLCVAALAVIAVVLILVLGPGKNDSPAAGTSPTPTAAEKITGTADEKKPVVQLMQYINKYGNHFENDKGEYYSIKKSVPSFDGNPAGSLGRVIENSVVYFTSRYGTVAETDFPLELGISNKDLHIQVWLRYNITSDSYELTADEDVEQKNPGSLKIRMNGGLPLDFTEADVYDLKEPVGMSKEEFLDGTRGLLQELYVVLEGELADMDAGVSMKTLGLEKR